MSIVTAQDIPLPCPLCGKRLTGSASSGAYFHPHPDGKSAFCLLAGFSVRAEHVHLWNKRGGDGPTDGLLMSMALRADHGLGVPGYYDQPMFAGSGTTHQQRLTAALVQARRMWEEVTFRGFYRPEKEAEYVALMPQGKQA